MAKIVILFIVMVNLSSALSPRPARAQTCAPTDRTCIIKALEMAASAIETPSWRDQTYRELAKTLAFDGRADEAIALLPKIEGPDTRAMAIRGIGMSVADSRMDPAAYESLFTKLRAAADTITHPPSFAVALTYIAMAQAFAGDNEGAWTTAAGMENEALRHKAYAETAEIQAERGNATQAMKSIALIGAASFRNKAYAVVSKILADRADYAAALHAATMIDNPYKKAEALQYLLDKQKPREIPHLKD